MQNQKYYYLISSNVNRYELLYGNKSIDVADSYKYLGFPFTTQSYNPFKLTYSNINGLWDSAGQKSQVCYFEICH